MVVAPNVVFEEFVRRSVKAFPSTNPILILGEWLEETVDILKGFSQLKMCFNIQNGSSN